MRAVSLVYVNLSLVLLSTGATASARDGLSIAFTSIENGDANGDWVRDISDVIYLLNYLFNNAPAPAPALAGLCPDAASSLLSCDINGDATLDISDPVRLLSWLFGSGDEPVAFACARVQGAGAGQGATDLPLAWRAEGTFSIRSIPDGSIVFVGVTENLNVSHLGLSSLPFEISAALTSPTTVSITGGTASFAAANGDSLNAVFSGGNLDLINGQYFLLFAFAGGTGRFSTASGAGRTEGVVDLSAGTYQSKNFARISY